MQQIQRALGKDMNRLERVVLTFPSSPNIVGASQWRVDPALLTRVLGKQRVWYIVDPLGNIVLSYPAGVNPEDMLDDLKYLMRVNEVDMRFAPFQPSGKVGHSDV